MRTRTLILLLGLVPAPALAQSRGTHLSLRPQIGIYVPTENLVQVSQTGAIGKLQAGPSFGAAVGLQFGSHFGVEANGAYVPTTFEAGTSGSFQKQNARLFLGSALAVIHILPSTSPVLLFVDGGVGVISHGGVAFTSEAKNTNLSGVAGAGVGIRLGGIQLIAGTDLYRYTANYQGSQQTASQLSQTDFAIKLGLSLGMGR